MRNRNVSSCAIGGKRRICAQNNCAEKENFQERVGK